MEENVFLLDSRYLNKVVLASGQNQLFSHYGEDSTEQETYEIEIVQDQDSQGVTDILSNIHTSDINNCSRSLDSVKNESHIFVPCMEDGRIVMTPIPETCIETFLNSDDLPEGDKSTTISDVDIDIVDYSIPTVEVNSALPSRDPPPKSFLADSKSLTKLDTSFCLRKSNTLSTCYKNRYNQSKYLCGEIADEYSIYSGMKSSTKYHGVSDKLIMIPPQQFKRQLTDVSDTTRELLRMPSTRAAMNELEWSVSHVFARPATVPGEKLLRLFKRNCITSSQPDSEDVSDLGLLPVGYQAPIDRSKIKRITRKRKNPDAKQTQLQKMLQLSRKPHKTGHLYEESLSTEYLTIEEPAGDWDGCYFLSEEGTEDSSRIIIIQDEGRNRNSMEVLLAAAEEPGEGMGGEEEDQEGLYFCQEEETDIHETVIPSEQIIFVTDCDEILGV